VYIEKEDGRQRPLGVAALEDKIVQYAVVTILNQIYEEDFLGYSYGFRSGRSQHDALDALSYTLLKKKVNYVLDADVKGSLDSYSQCSCG
jgi:retron-type reverse transcriptase